jgi:hypothetical protein
MMKVITLSALVAAAVATESFGPRSRRNANATATNTTNTTSNGTNAAPSSAPTTAATTAPKSKVQAGWDNHFAAFAASDVTKILLDYTEESQIITYDQGSGRQDIYTGLTEIETAFTGLFAEIKDCTDVAAPVIKVEDENTPSPQVFLMWSCASKGIIDATDTFAFNSDGKIVRQNVVFWRKTAVPRNSPNVTDLNLDQPGSAVQAGWDNHFGAFGAQNVTKILLDYTDDSKIFVYDITADTLDTYTGVTGNNSTETLFTGLFGALYDLSDLAAPLVRVEVSPQPMVVLIWEAPASGFLKVTDTFLFNSAGKIIRQNVVAQSDGKTREQRDPATTAPTPATTAPSSASIAAASAATVIAGVVAAL